MLVVGAPAYISQNCLLPALPRFHARYPDIQIDIRVVNRLSDPEAGAVDVFVLAGWPEPENLINRRAAEARFLVCASPGYWAAHGIPQQPKDLAQHQCLLFRNPERTVLDLWRGDWEGKDESVTVSGWLISSHRDVLLGAVLAGEGVARVSNLSTHAQLRSGLLVPALLGWELRDAPPLNLLFRPKNRRTPRVRLFVEFFTEYFHDLQAERDKGSDQVPTSDRPYWYRHSHGRASAAIRRP
jgi:DNA-binding transcriptional LysR family regulator